MTEAPKPPDKSFITSDDPRLSYCVKYSVKLHPAQQKLLDQTMNHEGFRMMGDPFVLQYCANLIQLIEGKRALDVGAYTGASALQWALCTPDDGEVITMDVSDEAFNAIGLPIIKELGLQSKITLKLQPALQTLNELVSGGRAESFDFAFIDALKEEYVDYYEKCMELVRPGGIIAIDNSLAFNTAYVEECQHPPTVAIRACNNRVFGDARVNCTLLPIGDGLMVAFKK